MVLIYYSRGGDGARTFAPFMHIHISMRAARATQEPVGIP